MLLQPGEIAKLANELRVTLIVHHLSLRAVEDPGSPLLEWLAEANGNMDGSDVHVDIWNRDGTEGLRMSAREALTKVRQLDSVPLRSDWISTAMLLGATRLGAAIQDSQRMRRDVPVLQFARHFRNACAHGDRWYFKGDEPTAPASTQSIVLSADMDGRKATWETVGPFEYIQFTDEVEAYFLEVAIHEAIDATFESSQNKPVGEVKAALVTEFMKRGLDPESQATPDMIQTLSMCISHGEMFHPEVKPRVYSE